MPNTYSQLHVQIIFAVKFREALIAPSWEETLYKYISGIFQAHNQKVLQVNGEPDHIHILIGLNPAESLSSIIQLAKSESTNGLMQKDFVPTLLPGRQDTVLFLMLNRNCRT